MHGPPGDRELRRHLERLCGVSTAHWETVATVRVPGELQAAPPPLDLRRPVDLGNGLYVAGDHRDSPSIQGAMVSGRRAATAVLRARRDGGGGMNILAASGGFRPNRRTWFEPGPIIDFAFELAGSPSRPRFCYVGTALGDNPMYTSAIFSSFAGRDVVLSTLAAFPMPSVEDVRAHLLAQDVVWVGGGSVAGLLAIWRLHGWDEVFREAWEAGVVLGGVSAGSLCWHIGGTTDSFGPELRPVTDGMALLPHSNGVHYDSEDQRRPLYHQLIADGTLPPGYATDDGVGLHYRGTELVEAVADRPGKNAYRVDRGPDGSAVETVIEPRLLPGASG